MVKFSIFFKQSVICLMCEGRFSTNGRRWKSIYCDLFSWVTIGCHNRSLRDVFLMNLRQHIEAAWFGVLWNKVLHGLIVYVATNIHSLEGPLDLLRNIQCGVIIYFFVESTIGQLSASCKYAVVSMTTTALPLSACLIIISLSCKSPRADLSLWLTLSVLGTYTSALCLISDLIRLMTDSSLVYLLGFGIQLLHFFYVRFVYWYVFTGVFLWMKIFFNSKPSCKLIQVFIEFTCIYFRRIWTKM